jgi:hypothetical protein
MNILVLQGYVAVADLGAPRVLTRAALSHSPQALPTFITMEKDSVIRYRLTSGSLTHLRFREGCFFFL